MPLEVTTTIAGLVAANPSGTDDLSTADDHIRLVKQVLVTNIPLTTAATTLGMSLLVSPSIANARALLGVGAIGDGVFSATTPLSAENALGVTRSIVQNGWRKTGDGLMVQWGTSTGTTNASSAITVTFPVAFPTGTFTVVAINGDFAATLGSVSTAGLTVTNFTATFVVGASGVGSGVAVRVNWIAYGN